MDVDHFDPRKKAEYIQRYDNLFPACRHCNGKKSALWPTAEMRALKIRFLDCTAEHDYGVHIFEDPESHEVFGVTPAGKYHVRVLDLNADIFVRQRALRAKMHLLLRETASQLPGDGFARLTEIITMFSAHFATLIPLIPYRKRG